MPVVAPEEVQVALAERELAPLLGGVVGQRSLPPQEVGPAMQSMRGRDIFIPRIIKERYFQPERLTPAESRRRVFERALEEERAKAELLAHPLSVSGKLSIKAQQRSAPSGADQRRFVPAGLKVNPRTAFGTEAYTFVNPFYKSGLRRHFTSPTLAVPCIQRIVKREVMFARRRAGRGYHKPKRRTAHSLIGC